jgi:hypothetical protein
MLKYEDLRDLILILAFVLLMRFFLKQAGLWQGLIDMFTSILS